MQHRGRCISGDSHPMLNMLVVVIANGACPPDGNRVSRRKTPAPPMRQPVSPVSSPALARKPPSGKKPPIPSSPKPRPTSPSAWTTASPTAGAGRLPARVAALKEAAELLQRASSCFAGQGFTCRSHAACPLKKREVALPAGNTASHFPSRSLGQPGENN